jgi:hypothetical protein
MWCAECEEEIKAEALRPPTEAETAANAAAIDRLYGRKED